MLFISLQIHGKTVYIFANTLQYVIIIVHMDVNTLYMYLYHSAKIHKNIYLISAHTLQYCFKHCLIQFMCEQSCTLNTV